MLGDGSRTLGGDGRDLVRFSASSSDQARKVNAKTIRELCVWLMAAILIFTIDYCSLYPSDEHEPLLPRTDAA